MTDNRPRAAVGSFSYRHRTVAQVDHCKGCNTPFPHCDCPEPVAAGVVPGNGEG